MTCTHSFGHFRSAERREVDVGDDGSQGTADIGKGGLAEVGSPNQPFVETSRKSPSDDGPVTVAQRLGLALPTQTGYAANEFDRFEAVMHEPEERSHCALKEQWLVQRCLSRNKTENGCCHAAVVVGLIWKPNAAARRFRAAMLRWRCCSS